MRTENICFSLTLLDEKVLLSEINYVKTFRISYVCLSFVSIIGITICTGVKDLLVELNGVSEYIR